MVFKKGNHSKTEWKKGNHYSIRTEWKKRQHISPNTEFKNGIVPWNKGLKMDIKIREKMSKGYKYHSPTEKSLENLKKGFTKENRKKLVFPKKDTKPEVKIQNLLKELNIEFYTHQYINIEHGYQCDIFIPIKNLIIECFGDYWHKYPLGREIDNLRCQELREKGFKVLIFWEKEIKLMNLYDLNKKIREAIL